MWLLRLKNKKHTIRKTKGSHDDLFLLHRKNKG